MPTINLQPYKVDVGKNDYPEKQGAMIDALESAMNAVGLGVFNLQGFHDASGGLPAGPVANDAWVISVAGSGYNRSDVIGYTGSEWIALISGYVVQSSTTDTTAGALMAVGACGVGDDVAITPTVSIDSADFKDVLSWVTADITLGTLPSGFHSGIMISRLAGSAGSQLLFDRRNDLSWFRCRTGNVWGGWIEIYHQGSILGTVSQSSGVPTGAIIERGSNANGEYVRYADGTQICTKAQYPLEYITSRKIGGTWTYPASFAASAIPALSMMAVDDRDTPDGNVFGESDAQGGYFSMTRSVSIDSAGPRIIDGTNSFASGAKGYVQLSVIGRWF